MYHHPLLTFYSMILGGQRDLAKWDLVLFIQQEVAVETFPTFRKSKRENYDHISKLLYFTKQL